MTKRAQYIDKFVEDLAFLALNGIYYKTQAFGKNPDSPEEQKKAEKNFLGHVSTLKATLCNIMENNEEQAEALMQELHLKWSHK